ncbi:MAG: hypothetical protein P4L22_02810 [Candidatus Babeliales bacterium]|nr:hypothetical protein [Candidatus Babeliales bacterium]
MKTNLKLRSITINNHWLKVASLLFGYAFWVMLGQLQVIELNLKVPLSFYGLQNNLKVDVQDDIDVHLTGKRIDFYNLDMSKLAVHVNLDNIKTDGKYNIKLLSQNIFLHNKIKLLNYSPTNLSLLVTLQQASDFAKVATDKQG